MKKAELAARQELAGIVRDYRARRLGGGGRLLGHRALDRDHPARERLRRGRHHARGPGAAAQPAAQARARRPGPHRRPARGPRAGAARRPRDHAGAVFDELRPRAHGGVRRRAAPRRALRPARARAAPRHARGDRARSSCAATTSTRRRPSACGAWR